MADRVISIGMLRSGLSEDRPWQDDASTAEVQPGAVRVLVPRGASVLEWTSALQQIIWAAKRDPNVFGS